MTNDPARRERMSKSRKAGRNPNDETARNRSEVEFGFRISSFFRVSTFDIRNSSWRFGLKRKRLRIDDRSFAHFLQSFHDDAVAGFQPILDDPLRVGSLAHLDGLDVDLIF